MKLAKVVGLILAFSVTSYIAVTIGALGLWFGDAEKFSGMLLALGIGHEICQTSIMARLYTISGSPLAALWLRPLAVFAMLYILSRTMWICRTHAVTWRGTTYGKDLRQPAQNFDLI